MRSQSRLTCAELKILPETHPYTESKTHGYSPRLLRFRMVVFKGKRKLGRYLSSYVKKVCFQSNRRPYDIIFLQKKNVSSFLHRLLLPILRYRKALPQKHPRTRSKRKLSFAYDSFDETLPYSPLKLERVFKSYCNVGRS